MLRDLEEKQELGSKSALYVLAKKTLLCFLLLGEQDPRVEQCVKRVAQELEDKNLPLLLSQKAML